MTRTFTCFVVDLTKAFDTVSRESLWKVLRKLGVPQNMLDVITAFHSGMKACVRSDGEQSESFDVTNGTKQGSLLLSSLCFTSRSCSKLLSKTLKKAFLSNTEHLVVF